MAAPAAPCSNRKTTICMSEVAAPQSVLGRIDRAVRRQQNDDDRRIVGQQLLQQLDAVHAGHLQVGQREIEAAFFGKLQRGLARSCGSDIVARRCQDLLKNVALWFLVVDYKNGFSWHLFRISPPGRYRSRF